MNSIIALTYFMNYLSNINKYALLFTTEAAVEAKGT